MDHKNLEFFHKPQDLSCCQARWQQILQEYHLVILHHSGKTNPADPLSRRPDFEKGIELDNKSQILLSNTLFSPPSSPISISAVASTSITSRITSLQYKLEQFAKEGLQKKDSPWIKQDGLVKWKNLMYISNDAKLHEDIIITNHNHPIAGHPGIKQTCDLIMSKYCWWTLQKDIKTYVKGCNTCQKVKAKNSTISTPLHPNEIPSSPWEIISINLIGPLPQSKGKNTILVIVDQFSKMIHLFLIMDIVTSKGVTTIFCNSIFKLHGTPRKVISDQGPQFISSFMKDLYELLNIKANPSTAYHPQTDGQTEQINCEVKKYLWIYVNHRQTDWAEWLALTEFAPNPQTTSATSVSPFLLNYRQQPIISKKQVKVQNKSASAFISKMKLHHQAAYQALEKATATMKKAHDKHA